MPDKNDSYLCEDGKVRTWGEMCEEVGPDEQPRNVDDVETLLWAYDATPLW